MTATTSSQGTRPPYIISQPVPSDPELSGLLLEKLQAAASRDTSVLQGLNVSADSFYSSQVHCTAAVHVMMNRAACACYVALGYNKGLQTDVLFKSLPQSAWCHVWEPLLLPSRIQWSEHLALLCWLYILP